MDPSIRMRIFFSVKHHHANYLKIGDTFLTSLTKLVLEVKTSICSASKENLFSNCGILKTWSVSQRNTACNRNNQFYRIVITLSK